RKALDLLRVSGEIAERENSERVTREHVKKAVRKIESDQVSEAVRTLPTQSKVLLFGMIILTESGYAKFTTGEAYSIYRNLCRRIGLDVLTQRRVSDLISELDMLGIINSIVISKGRYGRTREIKVEMPIEDLKKVLLEDYRLENLLKYEKDLKSLISLDTFGDV
ncbi:MAG: cell division control protein Cdc6, partial [Archaeoglobales archaeon]